MKRHLPPTTIAILGPSSLAEDILARLLRKEGYAIRLLDPHPTGLVEDLLDGVDVLLLAPDLKDGARGAFLEAMRSMPETADIPVLSISTVLKLALLDELEAGVPWRCPFGRLVLEIEASVALRREREGARTALDP